MFLLILFAGSGSPRRKFACSNVPPRDDHRRCRTRARGCAPHRRHALMRLRLTGSRSAGYAVAGSGAIVPRSALPFACNSGAERAYRRISSVTAPPVSAVKPLHLGAASFPTLACRRPPPRPPGSGCNRSQRPLPGPACTSGPVPAPTSVNGHARGRSRPKLATSRSTLPGSAEPRRPCRMPCSRWLRRIGTQGRDVLKPRRTRARRAASDSAGLVRQEVAMGHSRLVAGLAAVAALLPGDPPQCCTAPRRCAAQGRLDGVRRPAHGLGYCRRESG